MAELSDSIHAEIQRLSGEGDELAQNNRYVEALERYWAAWELLPDPKTEWDAAMWLLAAIADAHFFLGDFSAMRQPLMTAIRCDGATANPFLRLRLGQCLFEMGETSEAANWLVGAYLLEGTKIFANDDPKYLVFIKSTLLPPPGGWPEGW